MISCRSVPVFPGSSGVGEDDSVQTSCDSLSSELRPETLFGVLELEAEERSRKCLWVLVSRSMDSDASLIDLRWRQLGSFIAKINLEAGLGCSTIGGLFKVDGGFPVADRTLLVDFMARRSFLAGDSEPADDVLVARGKRDDPVSLITATVSSQSLSEREQ